MPMKRKREDTCATSPMKAPKRAGVVGPRKSGKGPPACWKADYPLIQKLRSKRDAPVDTIGCDRLADPKAKKADGEWQCLVAAMLSSQTKDQKTAEAMSALRLHGNSISSIASTSESKIEKIISMVGFHRTKAKHIRATAKICLKDHGGRVPSTFEGLISLPGVGPKMVHLTMLSAFGVQEGICVDVHVHRIANALGWIQTQTPEETRKAFGGIGELAATKVLA